MMHRLCFLALLGLFACNPEGEEVEGGGKCQILHGLTHDTSRVEIENSLAHESALYFITGQFGSNKQKIPLAADTGSSNLIAPDKHCVGCGTKFNYDADTSTTEARNPAPPFHIGYGSGSVTVQSYNDNFGLTCGDAQKMNFGSILHDTPAPATVPGIAGLAYASLLEGPDQSTVVDALVKTKEISNEFSMLLCGPRGVSHILLGGIDSRVKPNDLYYTPITTEEYYAIKPVSLQVGDGQPIPFSGEVIVDSGTTLTLLPAQMAKAIADAVKAKVNVADSFLTIANTGSVYTRSFSDAELNSLPDVILTLPDMSGGTFKLAIKPRTYLKDFGGKRAFGFREHGQLILGQSVMEQSLVHFDRKNKRIGFTLSSDQLCSGS